MKELSLQDMISVNGGAGLPDPTALLGTLVADVSKTASDALGDVMTTVNDLVSGLGLGSLGLGGTGGGLGLGGLGLGGL